MLTRFFDKIKKPAPKPPKSSPDGKRARNSQSSAHRSEKPVKPWVPGDIISGRYKVEEIMSGSMGTVYITEHLGWGIKIAIKSPRPEILSDREGMRCIRKEANSWIKMGMHPNIATCYFVLNFRKTPHLFIEYVDGGSLADWIQTGKCRDLRTVLSLAIQFCHGMEYTHSHSIIHRDIKPHNILITKNALLKITDFGIILSTSEQEDSTGSSDSTEKQDSEGFRGTPGYASPEQFRDSQHVDLRTDIFSFGICLWLMLCGRKPFKHNFEKTEIPEPVSIIPRSPLSPSLTELLKKCVAFEPDERFQDFASLRQALNAAYIELFKIACPYAELGEIDLRADSQNNRAVSYFELGKIKEATECIVRTLDINDVLPEAIYNQLLMKHQDGKSKPERLLRRLEAAKEIVPDKSLFDKLETSIKEDMIKGSVSKGKKYPELRLCVAKKSMEIFRDAQIYSSVKTNMVDHLEGKRFKSCHDILLTAWQKESFKKDKTFTRTYEQLLPEGKKTAIEGCQRLMTLRSGKGPATCIAFFPGTRAIISSGPDANVLFHDIGTKGPAKLLQKMKAPVLSMAVNPKGDTLGIGTEDGAVTLWSIKTRKSTLLHRHKGPITSLAFSPDGRRLATGCSEGLVKIVQLPGNRTETIPIHEGGPVRALSFYSRGHDFAAGSDDGVIRFFDSGNKEYVNMVEAHALPVISFSPSPDGRRLTSGSADRYVKIWERKTGLCKMEIKAHEESVTSVLMLPDNRNIVTSCEDDIIKVWDPENAKSHLLLDGRGDGICSLAAGPKPHIFLSGRQDGAIVLWMIIYRLEFD